MDTSQPASGREESACTHCGRGKNVAGTAAHEQELFKDSTLVRLQEITTEQSNTIEALRKELHDRDQRSDAIMAHYEQLVRMEKELASDAEEGERKAETEIVILTEELERLQSLLTAHGIAF